MLLLEPDVALTDLGLAVECAVLAALVRRGAAPSPLRSDCARFFLALVASSTLGAVYHGFFSLPGTRGDAVVWPMTMIVVGVVAACEWVLVADLLLPARRRLVQALAAAELALYALFVVFVNQDFAVAIGNYAVPTVLVLVALVVRLWRGRRPAVGLGVLGLLLSFAAAGLQQARVAIHPVYFNHNALYHLVQAVALGLVFVGLRSLARQAAPAPGRARS
jgi:hypothetical protein